MRRSWVWLRCASLTYAVFAVAHSMGMFSHPGEAAGDQVLAVMRTGVFTVQGFQRSYYGFFWGFGWLFTVNLVLLSALLWQMASRAKTDPAAVRSGVLASFVASVAICVLSWVYFFPAPGIVTALAVLFLVAALLTG